jgi:hypothetical protein
MPAGDYNQFIDWYHNWMKQTQDQGQMWWQSTYQTSMPTPKPLSTTCTLVGGLFDDHLYMVNNDQDSFVVPDGCENSGKFVEYRRIGPKTFMYHDPASKQAIDYLLYEVEKKTEEKLAPDCWND